MIPDFFSGLFGGRNRVAVVTDSTACLDPKEAQRAGIYVVPLKVLIDDEEHLDGDLKAPDLVEALQSGARVTTSTPSPADFAKVYREARLAGAKEIVSIHLSEALSGTLRAAVIASGPVPIPVHVVDAKTIGWGLAAGALAGAAAAREGKSGEDVSAIAQRTARDSWARFLVDTLVYLRRGGRLSGSAAALGTVLGVRPILRIADGHIEVDDRRASKRNARSRLLTVAVAEIARRQEAGQGVAVTIHHLDSAAAAQSFLDDLALELGELGIEPDDDLTYQLCPLSSVVAAHVGPGILSVVISDQ